MFVVVSDATQRAWVLARLAPSATVIYEPRDTSRGELSSGIETAMAAAVAADQRAATDQAEARAMLERLGRARDEGRVERADLTAGLAELRARLAAVETVPSDDLHAVREALAAYDAAGGSGTDTDPKAAALASVLEHVTRRAEEIATSEPGPAHPDELASAAHLVAGTAELVAEMESAIVRGAVPDEQRAEIDAALRELVDAEEALTGRFGGGAAKRRAAEAKERLDGLLTQAGFGSFLDLLVAGATVDGAGEQRLESARVQHRRAVAQLQQLEAQAEPSDARQRLIEEQWWGLRQTEEMLGFMPTDRIAELLRALPVVDGQATAELVAVLTGVGVPLTDQPLRLTARTWLATAEAQRRLTEELEVEAAVVEATLQAVDAADGESGTWDLLMDAATVALDQAAHRCREASQLRATLQRFAQGFTESRGEVATGGEAAATPSATPDSDWEDRIQTWRQMVPAGGTVVLVEPFVTLAGGVAEGLAGLATERIVIYITARESLLEEVGSRPPGARAARKRTSRPLVATRRPPRAAKA